MWAEPLVVSDTKHSERDGLSCPPTVWWSGSGTQRIQMYARWGDHLMKGWLFADIPAPVQRRLARNVRDAAPSPYDHPTAQLLYEIPQGACSALDVIPSVVEGSRAVGFFGFEGLRLFSF